MGKELTGPEIVSHLNTIHKMAEKTSKIISRFYEKTKTNNGATELETLHLYHDVTQEMLVVHKSVEAILENQFTGKEYVYPFLNGKADFDELVEVLKASTDPRAARNIHQLRENTSNPKTLT